MHQSDRHILLEAKHRVRRARAARKTRLRVAQVAFAAVACACMPLTVINGWGLGVIIVAACVGGFVAAGQAVVSLNQVTDDQIDRSLVQMVRCDDRTAADARRVLMSRLAPKVAEQVARVSRDSMLDCEFIRAQAEKAIQAAIDKFDCACDASFVEVASVQARSAVMQAAQQERNLLTRGRASRFVLRPVAV